MSSTAEQARLDAQQQQKLEEQQAAEQARLQQEQEQAAQLRLHQQQQQKMGPDDVIRTGQTTSFNELPAEERKALIEASTGGSPFRGEVDYLKAVQALSGAVNDDEIRLAELKNIAQAWGVPVGDISQMKEQLNIDKAQSLAATMQAIGMKPDAIASALGNMFSGAALSAGLSTVGYSGASVGASSSSSSTYSSTYSSSPSFVSTATTVGNSITSVTNAINAFQNGNTTSKVVASAGLIATGLELFGVNTGKVAPLIQAGSNAFLSGQNLFQNISKGNWGGVAANAVQVGTALWQGFQTLFGKNEEEEEAKPAEGQPVATASEESIFASNSTNPAGNTLNVGGDPTTFTSPGSITNSPNVNPTAPNGPGTVTTLPRPTTVGPPLAAVG